MTRSERRCLLSAALWLALVAQAHTAGTATFPKTGPRGQAGKHIVYIAENFKNGGVVGVFRGLEAAARLLGWQLEVLDGGGQFESQGQLFQQSLAKLPDAIVFGGLEPILFPQQLAIAKQSKIVLVGWHAAMNPGPTPDLFVNVATSADDVGAMAASFVIQDAKAKSRPLGVIIFNDKQFSVANAKTATMAKVLTECSGYRDCKVLSVENIRIADAEKTMDDTVARLIGRHGAAWTYSLAINDIYFDQLDQTLKALRRDDILLASAGDGSSRAIGRIDSGQSQQLATVAEPLKLQGYQLADELNRAFAGVAPSGFRSQPILVTKGLLAATGRYGIESTIGFEAAYAAIWNKKVPSMAPSSTRPAVSSRRQD